MGITEVRTTTSEVIRTPYSINNWVFIFEGGHGDHDRLMAVAPGQTYFNRSNNDLAANCSAFLRLGPSPWV
jgi:hypothetical protein